MKFIGICVKGLEDIAIKEIKELTKNKASILTDGRIGFDSSVKFVEKTKSLLKVYEEYGRLRFKTLDDIKNYVDKLNVKMNKSFRISCHREGMHDFNSQTVEIEIGKLIKGKHELKNPEEIIFVDIVDDDFFFGRDLTPKLLSKRDYRIKISNSSINACIAYSMIRLSGYDSKKNILDCFCKDGVIVIEAALYKKGKIYGYDELFHNIRSCEINSKLAGVNKTINLSRVDIEWLDTKFGEEEVDCVVSAIPFPSKNFQENKAKKIYELFLDQLYFILKKKGKAVVIGQNMGMFKGMLNKFKILNERFVRTGGLEQEIVVFSK